MIRCAKCEKEIPKPQSGGHFDDPPNELDALQKEGCPGKT